MKQKNLIITVGREYGSGGHDIAAALAERLGLPFYDNELISIAAKESGLGEKAFANAEKVATSTFGFALNASGAGREYGISMNDRMFLIQSGIIRTIADQESAIIVGRCSNAVLKDYTPTINIFIGASMEHRIKTVMARDHLLESDAKRYVLKMDKYRSTYYNFYTTDSRWGDRRSYDLCIDRSGLDVDTTVSILEGYINARKATMNLNGE
jgi:cytidylate kinase